MSTTVDASDLTHARSRRTSDEATDWRVFVDEPTEYGETATALPAIPTTRLEATSVNHPERRARGRDSSEGALDHLYRIRAQLLDLEDAGQLDVLSAARLNDVEKELASIQAARAEKVEQVDVGWARLDELARLVLDAATPASADSQ